jgi:hypothetical protein
MTVHLIKLSVGPDSLSQLVDWQTQRLKDLKRARQKPELMHITRHKPKRETEVLDGGSIYWVIKSMIVARQKLLELRPVLRDGIPHCALIYDPEMIMVQMRPRRAFQGWRYFETADVPPDIAPYKGTHDMPDKLQRELMAMGLL